MAETFKVAVLGPVPRDPITAHDGTVVDKNGCGLNSVAALSALMDGRALAGGLALGWLKTGDFLDAARYASATAPSAAPAPTSPFSRAWRRPSARSPRPTPPSGRLAERP